MSIIGMKRQRQYSNMGRGVLAIYGFIFTLVLAKNTNETFENHYDLPFSITVLNIYFFVKKKIISIKTKRTYDFLPNNFCTHSRPCHHFEASHRLLPHHFVQPPSESSSLQLQPLSAATSLYLTIVRNLITSLIIIRNLINPKLFIIRNLITSKPTIICCLIISKVTIMNEHDLEHESLLIPAVQHYKYNCIKV